MTLTRKSFIQLLKKYSAILFKFSFFSFFIKNYIIGFFSNFNFRGKEDLNLSVLPNDFLTEDSMVYTKLREWKYEVPFDILSDSYRLTLKAEIENLVGNNKSVICVNEFGAIPGNEVTNEFINAVNATPIGGTLIIPEGTWYVRDWEINKSIHIKAHEKAVIKRDNFDKEYATSTYIVRLSQPCIWDGGVLDGNRDSWIQAGSGSGRHHSMDVFAPCIVKNVIGRNSVRRTDFNTQWGGFRVTEGNTFFKNVKSEKAPRGFYTVGVGFETNNEGKIKQWKGVYYYNCFVDEYQIKGYDSSGYNGWIIYDGSSGRPIPAPEADSAGTLSSVGSMYLLETSIRTKGPVLHTGIIKNVKAKGYFPSQIIKSSGAKYILFDNTNLVNWGMRKSGSELYANPVYFCQIKDIHVIQKPIVIGFNSKFETRDFNEYKNEKYYNYRQAGTSNVIYTRDVTSSYPKGSFYLHNCIIEKQDNRAYRHASEPYVFWLEHCIFKKHKSGDSYQWFNTRENHFTKLDGIRIVFRGCQFLGHNNTYIVNVTGNGVYCDGILFINKPSGDYKINTDLNYSDSYPGV